MRRRHETTAPTTPEPTSAARQFQAFPTPGTEYSIVFDGHDPVDAWNSTNQVGLQTVPKGHLAARAPHTRPQQANPNNAIGGDVHQLYIATVGFDGRPYSLKYSLDGGTIWSNVRHR